MKKLKDRRKLLDFKNFNRCSCFGNPKSNEYDPKFCEICRKSDIFDNVDNRKCGLTDFILFNDSIESEDYASIVTDECLVLNYIDEVDDFKKLSDYFCIDNVSNIINNLYNLLIENFDKKLINKYIGFAITNTDIEDNLILYLYNKLDNKDYEDDTCLNSLHSVLIFNFGNVDDEDYEVLKIKYAKEFVDEDTFDNCYKYSKTYTEYDPKVILKYVIKLLNLNNNNDIKKETRYSYYYKLK